MTTTRMIRIETCTDCPHRDHEGALAMIPYLPVCRKTGRHLPYRTGVGAGERVVAVSTNVIPDWCPLDRVKGGREYSTEVYKPDES